MRGFSDDWCDEEYDRVSVQSRHDITYGGMESVSLAVVDAVSAVTGVRPTRLPPLAESIETDALDTLFSAPVDLAAKRTLTFCYAGCAVSITGDGTLTITLVE